MHLRKLRKIRQNVISDRSRSGARLDDPELEMSFLETVYDCVEKTSGSVQKTMLKSIVGCLLAGTKAH